MDALSEAIVRTVEAARATVLHVVATTADRSKVSLGSGLAIDHYHLVTGAHLVADAAEIQVHAYGGRKYHAALVAVDPLYALAVLRAEGPMQAEPARFAPVAEIPIGLAVVAVGNPLGYDCTATFGIVSIPDLTVYRPERIPVDGLVATDALIHPGNTGGALVSLDGRTVGLNGLPWVHNLGLAIQGEVVARVASQIIDFGSATHPWLGFSGQPEVIDRTLVDLFGLPADRGVVVSYVAPDGPGARAGVEPFDMVVRVDDTPVTHLGSIRKVLGRRRVGERGRLTLVRNGRLLDLEIPVEEIPQLRQSGTS
ncbi:MAG: trypsin-like peptidase domain-containing protein [Clostridia bacterium]|nr:trypsin-like peptidase domain-containing protein [Clostridia bacterium]